jgi:uncharacterized protein YlxW (UPF0749 family)
MLDKRGVSQLMIMAFLFLCVVAALSFVTLAKNDEAVPTSQQDLLRVETRLNQLEQRVYTIETSIRTLEQQARLSNTSPRSGNDDEIRLVRSEVDLLQRRLEDVECGLAKVDERTLSPAMRVTRRRPGTNDPCRANFETPISISR